MAITKEESFFKYDQGYLWTPPIKDTYRYMAIDDRVEEVRTVVVHEFIMGDVEDPDLYACEPLLKWEKSEKGQWVMNNAIETPSWHRIPDKMHFGYKYQIRAKLAGVRLTEYLLKFK